MKKVILNTLYIVFLLSIIASAYLLAVYFRHANYAELDVFLLLLSIVIAFPIIKCRKKIVAFLERKIYKAL